MDTINQMAERIIREQELIIGNLAWREAAKIDGLSIDLSQTVQVTGNNKLKVIDNLVKHYEQMFGRASHDVCRHAVIGIISNLRPAEIPLSLR